ncbi:hypothetical protein [Enterocloster citroniae]|uniref:Uncharacterized protein n=1 Tax=[Clostridium] citroniae WAL-17108 TaxID=742733 RepID=G5HQH9_9FIRM|nr:hypothetical protein [Enterocloster citroniae]EHE96305.1 hypothetical protein HMPREF9469_04841 [ [[Clostridium] citroniae WAL-17108]MCC3387096.1 hypothetical protein [Enterocloster citroniae]
MELTEFARLLNEQNEKKDGYQIHLNSGNLDTSSERCTGVEFGELYFTECSSLNEGKILCFGNMSRDPVGQKENGTKLYPMEINSSLFIDMTKVDTIEDLKDFEDWFGFPSTRVINVYMLPESGRLDGNRNVVTIGFMD